MYKIWTWIWGISSCGQLLFAQSQPAEQWADSVLERLSVRAQLAQLLIRKASGHRSFQPPDTYTHGLGGWELGLDPPLLSQDLPPLKVSTLSREGSRDCLGWDVLFSARDTAFLQEMGRLRATEYLGEGISVLQMDSFPCLKGAVQRSAFAYYLMGLCSSDLLCISRLVPSQEIDLGEELPLVLTEDYSKDIRSLRKRFARRRARSLLKAACRRILIHKHKTIVAPQLQDRPQSSSLQSYLRLRQGFVLLRNREQTLPLQAMDTIRPVSIAMIEDHLSPPFFSRLDDYLEMPHYLYSAHYSRVSISQLSSYTHIIVSLHTGTKGRAAFTDRQLSFMDSLQQQSNVLWLYFGTSEGLEDFPLLSYSTVLLLAHENSPMAQDLAAQALFGAVPIEGRLSVSLPSFVEGSGLRTTATDVLSFVTPELLNIDSDQLHSRIDRIVFEGLASRAFPGCQIVLAQEGRVFFYKSYGYHTYEQRIPVTSRSIYDLASLTKVMAPTTSLMRLYGDGRFLIEARLSTYLPNWRRKEKGTLDFQRILAHHSGLYPWIPYYKELFKKASKPKRKYLSSTYRRRYPTFLAEGMYLRKNFKKYIEKEIESSPLSHRGYKYSGLAFYLMPELIEVLSGRSYVDELKQAFYAPLGASTLGFLPREHFPLWRIVPTEEDTFFRNQLLHGLVHDEGAAMMGGVSGNAGLFAKSIDVAKIWQMYLQDGSYGCRRYLRPESVRRFTSCQFCDEGNRRGLGFDRPLIRYEEGKSNVAPQASAMSFGHTGFTGTIAWADPANGLLFVFLSNRVHPSRSSMQLYLRNIRPRIHQVAYELLGNERRLATNYLDP